MNDKAGRLQQADLAIVGAAILKSSSVDLQ